MGTHGNGLAGFLTVCLYQRDLLRAHRPGPRWGKSLVRQYIINRLQIVIPTRVGMTILIFLAMRIIPGDPLQTIYSESTGVYILSEEELAEVRASLGLNKPVYR